MSRSDLIVFEDVSKFYGEVLGVNGVHLEIEPGITGLVGPNGSGKTTLMNLMAGLLRPDEGRVSVVGLDASRPEELFRLVGYSTQYDAFPRGATGYGFIYGLLRVHGFGRAEADRRARESIERVGLTGAMGRKVAAYSKGMRQRIKLAQALAHRPAVLVLDEPLNGLDPMARAEMLDLFRRQADEGLHVLVSSHILHEVDDLSDRVVLLNGGYVVAEGRVEGVREDVEEQATQILVRCDRPRRLAARLFAEAVGEPGTDAAPHAQAAAGGFEAGNGFVTEVTLHEDGCGLFVRTRTPERFYLTLNRLVREEGLAVEAVAPADADVGAVYRYLIGEEGSS